MPSQPHHVASPPPTPGLAQVHALPLRHSDSDVAEGLRRNEPWARAALFDRYYRDVERVLAWVLGIDHELPDLLHDVFLTAWQQAGSLRDDDRLRPWLVSIAVFTARGCIRKRQRRALLHAMIHSREPDELVTQFSETSEVASATRAIIGRLKTEDRLVFTLRFIGHMELAEIADACGISTGTVKRRLTHARARFESLAVSNPVLADWLEGADR